MIKAYAAFEPGGKLQPFEYDPGELGASHPCGHRHVAQRGHIQDVPAGPGEPGSRRHGRRGADDARPADRLG